MRDGSVRLYAGFDGGGTRTTCVLCDSEGSVLGVGYGGRSNYHDTGVPKAVASLKRSFEGALARSKMTKHSGSLEACFGLAGLDSPKDMETMSRAIRSMALGPSPRKNDLVVNDWRTAVAGAFIDDPGVALIAGTGCVAAAQCDRGRKVVRVGGWGHIVDDRGSAYDIGREALYAAFRDYDGRGPKTMILQLIMRRLKVREPQGIIARVYAERMSVPDIASLSAIVSEAADRGDAVALKILGERARILGELVVSAASRLGMLNSAFGVSPHGGVFKAGRPILGPLEMMVHASAPLAEIVEAKLPPVCGAVLLSMRRSGRVEGLVIDRMRSSFETASAKAATRMQGAGSPRARAEG